MQAKVTIDLTGLKRFQSGLRSSPVMNKMTLKWAKQYNQFMVSRFKKFSRGGGNWPKLKQSTIARKIANKSRILVELGDLLSTLSATVNLNSQVNNLSVTAGIRPGVGHTRSSMSLQDLVAAHQTGAGNLPVREVVVFPPATVIKKMVTTGNRALAKHADNTGR